MESDPTNGKLGRANIFVFIPAEWVEFNTLKFFERGVRELITHQVRLYN